MSRKTRATANVIRPAQVRKLTHLRTRLVKRLIPQVGRPTAVELTHQLFERFAGH